MYDFGVRLRRARKTSKLTLEDVAQRINSTRQTISRYENGVITNVPIPTVRLLAAAVNTTPEYLMGWDDTEKEITILPGTTFRVDYSVVIEDDRYYYFNLSIGDILYFNTDVRLDLFNSFHLVNFRNQTEIALLTSQKDKIYGVSFDGYHLELELSQIIATCYYKCTPIKTREEGVKPRKATPPKLHQGR